MSQFQWKNLCMPIQTHTKHLEFIGIPLMIIGTLPSVHLCSNRNIISDNFDVFGWFTPST